MSDALSKAITSLRESIAVLMKALDRLASTTQVCVVDVRDVKELLTSHAMRVGELESRIEVLEAMVPKGRGGDA